ncbi:ABC transporter substrate-binding protein [Ktedonobacteria bacterium brp13]|nr:ABC transporter substrate-binding protein [Ktedonobacteria bacterium brp13]
MDTMKTPKTVRVGAAEGFYGDALGPAIESAQHGNIRYLCFDCLAELTMAILQKDRQKDSSLGYTRDITPSMKALLPIAREKGIKILTNAGGINPKGALKEVMHIAKDLGLHGLKIACVTGDDLLDQLDELRAKGISLDHMETGQSIEEVLDRMLFANAYLGTEAIVDALRYGADVVITGRTTDSAQFLAPLIYEFGWQDEDRLAQGILMAHLLECSGQSTGGNFSGDWRSIENLDRIGFPIAEVQENGEFVITKPGGTGGLVSVDTVKEQMVYEIHDPSCYITPDVVLDMTSACLEDVGPNLVQVTGARGKRRPDTLKVVMGYQDGWLGQAMVGFSWPDALEKAQAADRIVRKQIEQAGLAYNEIRTDFIGYNSLHGPLSELPVGEPNEIYLRIAVRARDRREAEKLGRFFPPLALNGPPTMSGFMGITPPRELLGMWSCLVPREEIESKIEIQIEEIK